MFAFLRRRRSPARTRPTARPWLEALEDRAVPTVAFSPHFSGTREYAPSGTTITQEHNGSLNSAPVVLIFSGPYWTTTQGASDRQFLTSSIQSILSGPYLSALTQYGSDGKASFFASWQTSSVPTLTGNTPTTNDLKSFVATQKSNHSNALPSSSNALYIVINDPNKSGSSSGTFGYNFSDGGSTHEAYVGAKFFSKTTTLNSDALTQVFSHELAEAMAPAVHVTDPGGLGLGYQIADGEPEYFGAGYTYRLKGVLVQAYWSQKDLAFVVPDGNSQRFSLSWATTTFNNTFNLQVIGDQLGTNYNDDITVDRSPNTSGTRVTMNNQSVEFAPGAIKAVNISTVGGYDTVRIKSVLSGETVNVDSLSTASFDDVIVGNNGSLSDIQGPVNVSNTSGRSWLRIDASAGPARNITITDHSVSLSGAALISYAPTTGHGYGVMGLEIDDGFGANLIDVESVPALMPISIEGNPFDVLFGPAAGKVGLNRFSYLAGYLA